MKETQLMIEEKLGAGSQILSRTIFHGQHAINGLLEATDAKLKEELSLIVPLKIWQDAATQARKKGRELSKEVSEINGMICIRENDIKSISQKYASAKEAADSKEKELIAKRKEIQQLAAESSKEFEEINLESRYLLLHDAEKEVKSHEIELESAIRIHQDKITPIELNINEIKKRLKELSEHLWKEQRETDRQEAALAAAEEVRCGIEKKWGVTDITDLDSFIPPSKCPSCKQSIQDGDSHEHLKIELVDNITAATKKIETLSSIVALGKERIALVQTNIDSLEIERDSEMKNLEHQETLWKAISSNLHNKLQAARAHYTELSSSLSSDVKQVEYQNNLKHMQANARAELQLHESGLDMLTQVSDTTKMELDSMTKNVETLKSELEAKTGESSIISKVAEYCGARGIQTFVLQNAVLALQVVTQSYLDELSDGSLRLKLQLDDGDRISRTVSVLGADGSWVDRPLSSLSG